MDLPDDPKCEGQVGELPDDACPECEGTGCGQLVNTAFGLDMLPCRECDGHGTLRDLWWEGV